MIRASDVEARLGKHKSIADCAVIGVADPRVGKLVVAVVQVVEGHYLDAPELGAWCRAHLPSTHDTWPIRARRRDRAFAVRRRGSRSAHGRSPSTDFSREPESDDRGLSPAPSCHASRKPRRTNTSVNALPTLLEETVTQWIAEAPVLTAVGDR